MRLEVFRSGDQGSKRRQLSWTAIVLGSYCRFVSLLLPLDQPLPSRPAASASV
jgi:hypothetical protein